MQKKLIALAVAGLVSSGAMAQVTFYGVFDAAVMRVTGEQTTGDDLAFNGVNGGNLSGNRLGFNAEEDLGGGLKAVGKFELGSLNIDNTGSAGAASGSSAAAPGNGITGTRQSYLGLSSASMGTLVTGRLQTPGYDVGAKHDALGAGTFSPYATLAGNAGGSNTITSGGDTTRVNNGIAYISPKLADSVVVKVAAARTVSELSTAAANGDVLGVGVEFSKGPLDISAVLHTVSEFGAATRDLDEMIIGVNYNLGVAKLMASYISTTDTTGSVEIKGSMFQVGAQIPMGSGTIKVAYGSADNDGAAATDAATTFGIDYEHAFGKRTTGYVGLNMTDVGGHTGTSIAGVTAGKDKSITAIGAGLRLTF